VLWHWKWGSRWGRFAPGSKRTHWVWMCPASACRVRTTRPISEPASLLHLTGGPRSRVRVVDGLVHCAAAPGRLDQRAFNTRDAAVTNDAGSHHSTVPSRTARPWWSSRCRSASGRATNVLVLVDRCAAHKNRLFGQPSGDASRPETKCRAGTVPPRGPHGAGRSYCQVAKRLTSRATALSNGAATLS
jgi:hypothetical protein